MATESNNFWKGEITAKVETLEREMGEMKEHVSFLDKELRDQVRRVENKLQYGLGILAILIPGAIVILRKLLG